MNIKIDGNAPVQPTGAWGQQTTTVLTNNKNERKFKHRIS